MDKLNNLANYLTPRLLASIGDDGGDPNGGAGGDDKDKKPVTAGEVGTMVKDAVGKAVNAAVKDHISRALKGDDFKAAIGDALKGALPDIVKETVETAKAEFAPAGGGDDKGKKGGKGDEVPPEVQKQFAAQAKEIEKLKKERDDEKAAREAEKRERETSEERAALTKALTEGGVAPKRVKAAVAQLYLDEKRVVRNDKGELFFKLKDDDGDEVEYSLVDGVKKWVATEDGQEFLPAKQVSGSGGGQGGAGKPGAGKGGDTNAPLPMSFILGGGH